MLFHLVEDLASISSVTPEYVDGESLIKQKLEKKFLSDPWGGCVKLLALNQVDICATELSFTYSRHEVGDYVVPYFFLNDKLFSVLEYEAWEHESARSLWSRVWDWTRVFDVWVWLGLLLAMFGVAWVLWVYFGVMESRDVGFIRVWERVLRIILDQEYSEVFGAEEGRRLVKFLLLLWAWTALVVGEVYSGSLLSVTSLKYGYEAPFHDLRTMAESGYKFTIRSPSLWMIRFQKMTDQVRRFSSVEEYSYLKEMSSSPFFRRRHDTFGNISRELHYKRLGHKLAYTGTAKDVRSCQFHKVRLLISINNTFREWPTDFSSRPSSFLVNRRIPELSKKLNRAALQLCSTGNVMAIINRFKPLRERILSTTLQAHCASLDKTKLQVYPYSHTSAEWKEFESVFLFWTLLVMTALVVGCVEIASGGRLVGNVEKNLETVKTQALDELVNGLVGWIDVENAKWEVQQDKTGALVIKAKV